MRKGLSPSLWSLVSLSPRPNQRVRVLVPIPLDFDSVFNSRSKTTAFKQLGHYRNRHSFAFHSHFHQFDRSHNHLSVMPGPGTRARRNGTSAKPTREMIKIEIEESPEDERTTDRGTNSANTKPACPPVSAKRVQKKESEALATTTDENKKLKWEPNNWQTVLENIKKMRSGNDAPVDSMGCERTMEDDVDPKTKRYQTLVSLMLSSQTKDPITYAAMQRLQTEIGLNISTVLETEESIIGETIKPVSFWRRKATYIKNTTQILRDKFDGDIPDSVEGLCSLPGVGPKMAYICMNVAWNQNAGIGVDTHVHRIANRLQWTGSREAKTPEKTREGLESWLDPDLWQEINILLVGFGQTVCTAVNPKCSECLNNQLCSFGKTYLKSKAAKKGKAKKQSKKKVKDEEDFDDDNETSEYF